MIRAHSMPLRRHALAVLAGLTALAAVTALTASGCGGSATRGSTQQATRTTERIAYYHAAFAAGPTVITRDDGRVLDERRYEPFGAAIDSTTGPVDFARDPHNLLNKETEVATGWSDHGARWMAPETARWLTPDPPVKTPDPKLLSSPWSLHPYQYVEQNPVAYWDPDGRQPAQVKDHGRSPVDAEGKAQGPYAHATTGTVGVSLGTGFLNGPIGPGATGSALHVDVGLLEWVDSAGNRHGGVSVQLGLAKVAMAPGTSLGPVGFDAGSMNGEAVCYANSTDAVVGAQFNLLDGSVSLGSEANHVRVGLSLGVGFELRQHYGDTDGNGIAEDGFGFDFGVVEADVRTEAITRAARAVREPVTRTIETAGIIVDRAMQMPPMGPPDASSGPRRGR